jgi:hypothetical protein
MKLKTEHKKAILDDFAFAAQKMKELEALDQKMFYFSSTFGVLSRVFNIEFHPQLVMAHLVMTTAHANILTRINAMKGGDNTVMLQKEFFEKLTLTVEEFAAKVKKDEDIYDVVQKIAVLTFVTTGNGYYLLQRGLFNL